MADLADLSAIELAARIRAREASPVEAVEAALSQIDRQPEINAFITVMADQARDEAKRAEAALSSGEATGPLFGVPISIKDMVDVAGVPTTFGSHIFADNVAKSDAVTVERLKQAGAIVIGKTTTPEFAHKQRNDAPLFGLTLNPVDHGRTCGASSGGAGAAVAAKMGQLALGTDGGGSIRIPAACCGIVGFKGTLGVIPHLNVPDAFSANSYSGPMARDVTDTRLMFDVLAGADRRDPWGKREIGLSDGERDLKGLRVAWLPKCGNVLDPVVEKITRRAVSILEREGAEVEEVFLNFSQLEEHFLTILQTSLAARLSGFVDRHSHHMDPSLLSAIEKGKRRTAIDLHRAGTARTASFREVEELFTRFDYIVSPVLSAPPLRVDTLDPNGRITIAGVDAGFIRAAWYPYTLAFNLTGHPAISMPAGKDDDGLPIGLQIVGPWYSDRSVFFLAEKLEGLL